MLIPPHIRIHCNCRPLSGRCSLDSHIWRGLLHMFKTALVASNLSMISFRSILILHSPPNTLPPTPRPGSNIRPFCTSVHSKSTAETRKTLTSGTRDPSPALIVLNKGPCLRVYTPYCTHLYRNIPYARGVGCSYKDIYTLASV